MQHHQKIQTQNGDLIPDNVLNLQKNFEKYLQNPSNINNAISSILNEIDNIIKTAVRDTMELKIMTHSISCSDYDKTMDFITKFYVDSVDKYFELDNYQSILTAIEDFIKNPLIQKNIDVQNQLKEKNNLLMSADMKFF